MNIEPATSRSLFEEMRSIAFEARCLLDERNHSADSLRREQLLFQHASVQQLWDELFHRHSEACLNQARAVGFWPVPRPW